MNPEQEQPRPAEAKKEPAKSNRMIIREIMGGMGHEIRQSLNVLIGFSELSLQAGARHPAISAIRERLKAIIKSGRAIQKILDDFDIDRTEQAYADRGIFDKDLMVQEVARPLAANIYLEFEKLKNLANNDLTQSLPENDKQKQNVAAAVAAVARLGPIIERWRNVKRYAIAPPIGTGLDVVDSQAASAPDVDKV